MIVIKLFFKLVTFAILILTCTLMLFGTFDATVINNKPYDPNYIGEGKNVTREGEKYAYDSLKIQNYLLKGEKFFEEGKEEKLVFLTFDDGPSLDNTPKVLDILKEHNVKGTFFVLGINLDKGEAYRELLKRTLYEGHAIANHGYSHDYGYLYPGRVINQENLLSDMNKSRDKMKEILGKNFDTRVLRLPGGIRSWKGQTAALERLNSEGLTVLEWNALSGDAEGKFKTPDELLQNAIRTAGNSNVVVMLMHDFAGKGGRLSREALPKIIEYFKQNGYKFATLS